MACEIYIVGGLDDSALDRGAFLAALGARSGPSVKWEWVRSFEKEFDDPPEKPLRRLLARLRDRGASTPRVVKLRRLHNRVTHKIYQLCDPVHPPKGLVTLDQLEEWLFSADANLVPRQEWLVTAKGAALVAIFCKLLRKRSWNNSTQGHAWTLQEHLLGENPVRNSHYPHLVLEATRLLPQLRGSLLLKKGSANGATPLEWSINARLLGPVKRCIAEQTLDHLASDDDARRIVATVTRGSPDHRADLLVSERVRATCRQPLRIREETAERR